MSETKITTKKETVSPGENILLYSTRAIIVLIILLNIYGLYYVYSTFQSITNTSQKNITPDPSILINPLNTSLYKQVSGSVMERKLYTTASVPQRYSYKEIFAQPSTATPTP